jgi:hypothetical protein
LSQVQKTKHKFDNGSQKGLVLRRVDTSIHVTGSYCVVKGHEMK